MILSPAFRPAPPWGYTHTAAHTSSEVVAFGSISGDSTLYASYESAWPQELGNPRAVARAYAGAINRVLGENYSVAVLLFDDSAVQVASGCDVM